MLNQLPIISQFPVELFRQEFPFLQNHPEITYLDNTATSLKPSVLSKVTNDFYHSAGSVHRSEMDIENTSRYEEARKMVKQWLNVESSQGVIWTTGATHAINLVANGLADNLQTGDEIIISSIEHHANFLPWQQLALHKNLKLTILPLANNGLIEQEALKSALNSHTKIVALNWVSNITGVIQPMHELISLIRKYSTALIMVDGAQAVGHFPIDIQALDCDFLAFSAHKIYGATGVGALVGKVSSLAKLTPMIYGGKMVQQVENFCASFADLPYRLEGGTPNIAGVIALGEILKWRHKWDFNAGEAYAQALAEEVRQTLQKYPKIKIYSAPHSTIISFKFENIASTDLGMILGQNNITLRVGKHCAEPYLNSLGETSLVRISFAPYNNANDVKRFFYALDQALELL